MFDRLIAISREAFDDRQFNISYHALAAALHCARHEKNAERLLQVEAIANEQLKLIDRTHPEYEHSTLSAKTRGHESIFHLLARQASASERILHQEHARQEDT